MLQVVVFLTSLTATFAGYAGSTDNSVGGNSNYAYAGTANFPNPPSFLFVPVPRFDFNFFGDYFNSLQKYHQQLAENGYAYSYSVSSSNSPNSKAVAQSSITNNLNGIQQQVQQASRYGYPGSYVYNDFPNGVNGGSYGGSYGTGGYTGNGMAVASGGIGSNGGFQTAAVYPENPSIPNVNTRFSGMGFAPGTYGVFTSSQSGSSDINGKKYHYNKATTTINDNGKISTYTVHNP